MPTPKIRKLGREVRRDLRDRFEVRLRDLATRLLGNPLEGDDVVAGAFSALRRANADVVESQGAEVYLTEDVIDRCIRRFGVNARRAEAAAAPGRGRAA